MTLAGLLASARQPGKLMRTVLASWSQITREQILTTFLLGCALHMYRMVVSINIRYAAFIFVGDQIKAFILLLAIVAADRLTGTDPNRRGTYAVAVLIGAVVAGPLSGLTIWALIMLFVNSSLRPPGGVGFFLSNFFELLMIGGATVWVINDRRRARGERDRMHAAQLERIAAERGSIETELQAMQARVEPLFLFNTLASVRRLYARDAALGGQTLDALIAYLRAAMPRMRDTSSTVRQELELVRAYLDIARLRLQRRLTFAMEAIDPDVAVARMPAMMLLPLVDRCISRALVDGRSMGSIRVGITVADQAIRLEVAEFGGGYAPELEDEGVVAMRDRLAMLYGSDASLVIQRLEPDGSRAVLSIPHQRTPPPADERSAAVET